MKRSFAVLGAVFCLVAGGCAPVGPSGPIAGGPVYRGYYGQGYYNETPPGTYYGREAVGGPYYGGGERVAVVRTGVYRDRVYHERDYYKRDGRRYYRSGRPEYYRVQGATNTERGTRSRSKRRKTGRAVLR